MWAARAWAAQRNLRINSNDTIVDHTWIWRADHGSGAGWTSNLSANGLIVNGNNVTAYGLFVEHHQQFQVLWNGDNGRTYFYQSEIPYDPPDQGSYSSAPGVNGWDSYNAADTVTHHEAWAWGSTAFRHQRSAHSRDDPGGQCLLCMITVAQTTKAKFQCDRDAGGSTLLPRVTPNLARRWCPVPPVSPAKMTPAQSWDNGTVDAMTNETSPESQPTADDNPQTAPQPAIEAPAEPEESFGDLLAQFEKSHAHTTKTGQKQLQGTVISVAADQVFVDIGFKIEGVLPRSAFENNAEGVKAGDTVPVSVTGRNEEGYADARLRWLSPRLVGARASLQQKLAVVGTVTGRGQRRPDRGCRCARLHAGQPQRGRDAAEMEQLVGQQINCTHYQARCDDEDPS